MKKNILLLNPPGDDFYLRDCYCSTISKANYYWHPLDLLVQSGILSEDFNVFVLDANVLRLSEDKALQKIFAMDLDAILFLIGSLSWEKDLKFLETINRRKPAVKLIGSGEILRFDGPNVMKQYKFIDAILLDFTSNAILEFLRNREVGNTIDNFIYRFGNQIIQGDVSNGIDFEISIPKHELFLLNNYKLPFGKRKKFASVLSSYGCPYRCKFCNTSALGFKKRNIDNFIEELKYVESLGINKIFIRDATFGANREHTKEVCKRIIKDDIEIEWNCFSRVDTVDKGFLNLMKRAGCYLIQFGVESGDERILERYNKHININKIIETFENCRSYKIDTVAHFILGLPGEDFSSISKTINLAKKLNATYASFNIAVPRFGTRLREEYIENDWIDYDITDNYYPSMILTGLFTEGQLLKLKHIATRKFYFRPSYMLHRLSAIHRWDDILTLLENSFSMIENLRKYIEKE